MNHLHPAVYEQIFISFDHRDLAEPSKHVSQMMGIPMNCHFFSRSSFPHFPSLDRLDTVFLSRRDRGAFLLGIAADCFLPSSVLDYHVGIKNVRVSRDAHRE
jgi:hypothetical protein